jgi:hypothetical protein
MKKSIAQISCLGLAAMLSLSACGGGSSDSSDATNSATDVTVERGKVFGALVTDASTPAQVAVSTLNSNVYRFAKQPVYPIRVSGGYIDVNDDGVITQEDVALDMNMSSYSNIITPITTYLAIESDATLRQERLNGLVTMLLEMNPNSTVTAEDLVKLISQTKDEAALVANAIFAKYEHVGDSFSPINKTSIKSQYEALQTLLTQSGIAIGDANFAFLAEVALMLDLSSNGHVAHPTEEALANYAANYASEQNSDTTHHFSEGLSLDISNGITSNSIITLFKNDDVNTEMYFTLGANETATVQYIQNSQAIWQNTSYVYTVSGNTITCTLPAGGGLDIGQEAAPQQVVLTLGNSTVQAHVSATINGNDYTVFAAFGDTSTGESDTPAGTWSATPLSAPMGNVAISSDGKMIAGQGFDFSLHSYNVETKAIANIVTDAEGSVVQCLSNNDQNRESIRIDQSNTKFAFVCANSIRGFGVDEYRDQIFFYNATTDSYKLISSDTLTDDAHSLLMNATATKFAYFTHLDAGYSVLEYDLATDTTTTLVSSPYGLNLWDSDASLNTLVYLKNAYIDGYTHQQLIVNQSGSETVVGDLQQDIQGAKQFIDARLSEDGTKLIYISGNMYDSQRTGLQSLYMYDIVTGTTTTLEENFHHGVVNHNEWDISSDASKLTFIMGYEWGDKTLTNASYIYTFDVATKSHKQVYTSRNLESVYAAPDFSSLYTMNIDLGPKLVELSE